MIVATPEKDINVLTKPYSETMPTFINELQNSVMYTKKKPSQRHQEF